MEFSVSDSQLIINHQTAFLVKRGGPLSRKPSKERARKRGKAVVL
jgi:hypothetical protein